MMSGWSKIQSDFNFKLMKILVLGLSLSSILLFQSCHCCQKPCDKTNENKVAIGNTIGKVSAQYKSSGCSSIIITKAEDGTEIFLLPKDKLSDEFDKEGLEILFNYKLLKMPTPEGCSKALPAEITDITIKK